jgi:hypothetical protein
MSLAASGASVPVKCRVVEPVNEVKIILYMKYFKRVAKNTEE